MQVKFIHGKVILFNTNSHPHADTCPAHMNINAMIFLYPRASHCICVLCIMRSHTPNCVKRYLFIRMMRFVNMEAKSESGSEQIAAQNMCAGDHKPNFPPAIHFSPLLFIFYPPLHFHFHILYIKYDMRAMSIMHVNCMYSRKKIKKMSSYVKL